MPTHTTVKENRIIDEFTCGANEPLIEIIDRLDAELEEAKKEIKSLERKIEKLESTLDGLV